MSMPITQGFYKEQDFRQANSEELILVLAFSIQLRTLFVESLNVRNMHRCGHRRHQELSMSLVHQHLDLVGIKNKLKIYEHKPTCHVYNKVMDMMSVV